MKLFYLIGKIILIKIKYIDMGNDHFDKFVEKTFTDIKEAKDMAKKKFRDIVTRRLNVSTYEFRYQDYKESLIEFKNSGQEFLSMDDQVQIIKDKIREWIKKGDETKQGHTNMLLIVYFEELGEKFREEALKGMKITEKGFNKIKNMF